MLDPGAVAARLRALAPEASAFRVALSGGRDSVALLHLLTQASEALPAPLSAVHVDHGLHPRSAQWAGFCRALGERLGVPVAIRRVEVAVTAEAGIEAAAREARYAALAEALPPQGCVVLAHHADDQAETFLFRALRGSGVRGLSAMPHVRPFGHGVLARPLLGDTREAITAYAAAAGLDWIDDPANHEERHARVFLRRRVLPALAERWPAAGAGLAAAAEAARSDRELLAEYLDADLARLRRGDGRPEVAGLRALPEARRLAVVSRWLEVAGLRPPPRPRLADGLQALLEAGPDADPRLAWAEGVLRRHRGRLALLGAGAERSGPEGSWTWRGGSALPLPGGVLHASWSPDAALDPDLLEHGVSVRFRAGLEPRERRRAQRLFQRLAVPTWERDGRPLLMLGSRPVAVAGFGVAPDHASTPGLKVYWEPETPPEPDRGATP